MTAHGLDPSHRPSSEEEKPAQQEQRRALARTVGSFVALAMLFALLFLALFAAVWLDKRGLGTVAALAAAPLSVAAYQVFSRWRPVWKWITVLARFFPPMASLLADERRRQAISCLVEHIECVAGFYEIQGLFAAGQLVPRKGMPRFNDGLRKKLIDSIPVTVGPDEWAAELIDRLAQENPAWKPETREVLELLYQERLGRCDWTLWQKVRADEDALGLLAGILAGCGKLPAQPVDWRAGDLAAVLRGMDRFSWDLLHGRLHELGRLAGKAVDYLRFLKDNGVAERAEAPTVETLSEIVARPPAAGFATPEAQRDAALLVDAGRAALREAPATRDETEPVLRRYALLSAILYLTRSFPRHSAREQLCRDLAADEGDEGVRIAWAYLDLKQDFRSERRLPGRPFLGFDELVRSWRSKLDRAARESYLDGELGELRSILAEGSWVNRLSDLLDRAQSERLKKMLPPSPVVLKKDEMARQVVERYRLDHRPELLGNLVRQVDLEALARNLEAGRFIPYLITFRADHGPLSRLVDCLTIPKKLKAAGVANRYDFRRYTENARIGLVPEGWSFEQLGEAFQQDFAKVLAARRSLISHNWEEADLEGIEVMLHRFSAVGRCAFESELSRRVALSNLKDLLAENLPPEKLVALVQSSTAVPLKDHVLSASIPDVVGDEAPLTTTESKLLESQDGQIKRALLGRLKLDSATIPQLARRLSPQDIDRTVAAEALAEVLGEYVPHFDERRSSRIAKVYLDGLESLAAA